VVGRPLFGNPLHDRCRPRLPTARLRPTSAPRRIAAVGGVRLSSSKGSFTPLPHRRADRRLHRLEVPFTLRWPPCAVQRPLDRIAPMPATGHKQPSGTKAGTTHEQDGRPKLSW
jgi:hypothetical protein